MNTLVPFAKSSSGKSPTRTPDTLRSKDTVEVVLGLCKGPIRGPALGAQGIYVGNTPLMNSDNTENFNNFEFYFRPGNATDGPVEFKLGGQSQSESVGVNLYHQVAVVRQCPNVQCDALEARIVFNQIMQVNRNGDQLEHQARVSLEYKAASSSTWLPFFPPNPEVIIRGKTTSTYAKDFRVLVPRINEPYEIRVTKTSTESDEYFFVELAWESFQVVQIGPKAYPGLAIAHLIGEATDQFSSLPQFSGIYDLMLCRMPNVYNPYTRSWTGTWDGLTWKTDWTDNPALVLNEIIANEDWGIAAFYPAAYLDRFDLVAGINHCDVQVSDGRGGTQPRYSYNGLITEPRPGPELARFTAGLFGGTISDSLEEYIRLRLDVDGDAVALFTAENTVSEGGINFNYSYTASTSWYNDITVVFRNPNLEWEEDRRRTFHQPSIDEDGRIPLDLVAEGCTDEHEALRRAYIRLLSAQTEKRMVRFKTTRLALAAELFEIFLVADPDMDWGVSGRLRSVSGDRLTVHLRDQIYLEPGVSYEMVFQTAAGPVTRAVPAGQTGGRTAITFAAALPAGIEAFTTFALQAPLEPSLPRPFRLLNISEVEGAEGLYEITGLEVNRNKQYAADTLTFIDGADYSRPFDPNNVRAPTNLTAEVTSVYDPTGLFIGVRLNWTRSAGGGVRGYEVWYEYNGSAAVLANYTEDTTLELPRLPRGTYRFLVFAVSVLGVRSHTYAETVVGLDDPANGTSRVNELEILGKGADTTFNTPDVTFSWWLLPPEGVFPDEDDLDLEGSGFNDPTLLEYRVQVLHPTSGAVLFEDWTANSFYTFRFYDNLRTVGGPHRWFQFRVVGRDSYERFTAPLTITVTNAQHSAPEVAVEPAQITCTLRPTTVLEPDIGGFKVWLSDTSGFTPNDATNLIFDGPAPIVFPVPGNRLSYFRVAAYDVFGKEGVTASPEDSFLSLGVGVNDWDSAAQNRLQQMEDDFADAVFDIEEISTTVVGVQNAVNDLTDDLADVVNDLSDLTTVVGSIPGDLNDALDEIRGDVSTVQGQIVSVNSRVDDTEAAVNAEALARANGDSAIAGNVSSLTTRMGSAETAITNEQVARSNADSAIAGNVSSLTTRMGSAESAITNEVTARTNADSTIAGNVTALTTRMGDAESAITNEVTARTNADSTIAGNVSSLTTRMGSAESAITNEVTARTNADSTIAGNVTALTTRMGTAEGNITSLGSTQSTHSSSISALQNTVSASASVTQGVSRRPDRPAIAEDFTGTTAAGNPASSTPLATGTVQVNANEGNVRRYTGQAHILTRGALPVGSASNFRVTGRSRVVTNGTGTDQVWVGIALYNSSWTYLGSVGGYIGAGINAAAGWRTSQSPIYSSDDLKTAYATAVYGRGYVRCGLNSGGTSTGSTWEIATELFEEVLSDVTLEARVEDIELAQVGLEGDILAQAARTSTLELRNLGRTNIIPNGDLSRDPVGNNASGNWYYTEWGYERGAWNGNRLAYNGTGSPYASSPIGVVQPGTTYTFGATVSDLRTTNKVRIAPEWFLNATDAQNGVNGTWGPDATTLNAEGRLVVTAAAPASRTHVRLAFITDGNATGAVYVTNVIGVIGAADIPNAIPAATLTQVASVAQQADGRIGAMWGVDVTAGGSRAAIIADVNGNASKMQFMADAIEFYDGTTHQKLMDLASGTLRVRQAVIPQITASMLELGATTGGRIVAAHNVIKVYDEANNLRVQLGDLSL